MLGMRIGVQIYKKFYQVDDKETNKILILKHGSKERPMKMCFISNGEFTGAEFTKWINRMQRVFYLKCEKVSFKRKIKVFQQWRRLIKKKDRSRRV